MLLLGLSIIIFSPALLFSWTTAIGYYKKLLSGVSLDASKETAATETQSALKLVIKYFLLNVLLNVMATPIITFVIVDVYIKINPPATALFIEPLLIPLFFSFPYVFFVVSLLCTIILIKREAFLSIDKKLLMLYVNLTLPLFLFFLTLVVMPYYSEQQAKQRAQQQKEDKENARIEIIEKYSRNLYVSQCREEVIPAINDYDKSYFPQWFVVNCILDVEKEGNYHVKGSIKEFDQNGVEQIQSSTVQVLIDESEDEKLGLAGTGIDEHIINLTPGKHQLVFKLLTPAPEIRYYLLNYKFNINEGKSLKGWVMNLPLKELNYTSKKYDLTKYPYKVID